MVVDLGVPLQFQPVNIADSSCANQNPEPASYLGLDVVEGGRADDGEADEENVGLGIRKGSQSVVVFLAGGIPETQADRLPIDHYARGIVIETVGDRRGQTRLIL